LYNNRREQIRSMLQTKAYVTFKELSELFPDVSEMTIRRDIEHLEREHVAIRVRGGARSMRFITNQVDDSITSRQQKNVESKEAIVEKAAKYLEPGRSIFLDSGSTLQKIVKYIPNERFSFTTTDPSLALGLCKIGLPMVNLVGGRLDGNNQTVTGIHAMRFLGDINIDIAFLSPSGFSARSGFTVGNYSEGEIKRIVVSKARLVVMLMDESKFDKSLPYTFADAADADIIITNRPLPADMNGIIEKNNITVTIVDDTI